MIDPRDFGALEAKVEALEKVVSSQSKKIDQLLELANKGKGAFWFSITFGGVVGSAVTWFGERLFR